MSNPGGPHECAEFFMHTLLVIFNRGNEHQRQQLQQVCMRASYGPGACGIRYERTSRGGDGTVASLRHHI